MIELGGPGEAIGCFVAAATARDEALYGGMETRSKDGSKIK
jgi:hypothetical protein